MKFEEFEEKIKEKGFGIVAMNHYAIAGERMILLCCFKVKIVRRLFRLKAKTQNWYLKIFIRRS